MCLIQPDGSRFITLERYGDLFDSSIMLNGFTFRAVHFKPVQTGFVINWYQIIEQYFKHLNKITIWFADFKAIDEC